MICPKCRSISVIKNGMGHTNEQHYLCKECNYDFPVRITNTAKILIFDIENAPVEAYIWNKKVWNATVTSDQLKEDWFMICWAAKWLNSPKVIYSKITKQEALARDDKRIVQELWELFDEADIIIAHNAYGFDIPMVTTKFIIYGMNPPKPYRVVDTLKVAKRVGSFTYNSLDYLGQILGVGRKKDTEFQLWIDCIEGKAKALKEMSDYNIQDVLLLEEVYLKLRGWTHSHPNLNLFQPESGCANCGSMKIRARGQYRTQTATYKSWQCLDCGGFSRETKKTKISTAR